MKTILITGATGFVGLHTLKFLSDIANIDVIVACRDKNKLPPWFKGEIREGDVRDENYVHHLFYNIDVVINAMSWSSLWANNKESNQLFLIPSLKLINGFIASNAQKIINISSTAVSSNEYSHDATGPATPPLFWPHLCNVIKIEQYLQDLANDQKTVINLRFGIFTGAHYALGLLPILVPRLKTHLVPWVASGQTTMPLIDGRDIGQAMALAALNTTLTGYQSFNVVGPSVPKTRHVIEFLCKEYRLPKPHFSVPFSIAYPFAWLMEKFDAIVPWDPLIVRSIILLLEDTRANNDKITQILGYQPKVDWTDSINIQMNEMSIQQKSPMKMAKPIL